MGMPKKAVKHIKANGSAIKGNKSGTAGKTKRSNLKPYEPIAEHLRWYEMYAIEHKSYRVIGREVNRTCATVFAAVTKVSAWMRLRSFDRIVEYRDRQTETLEAVVQKSLRQFEKSIGEHEIRTVRESVSGPEITVRTESLNGNPAYLSQAITAMAEIRKIWGVDKAQKIEVTENSARGDGLGRVDGMSRSEALEARAASLIEMAKLAKTVEGSEK